MARNITQKQKTGYYLGMILIGIGIIMFSAPFIDVLFNGLEPNERGLPESFKVALVGFVLLASGNVLRSISARGLAGSGLLLLQLCSCRSCALGGCSCLKPNRLTSPIRSSRKARILFWVL